MTHELSIALVLSDTVRPTLAVFEAILTANFEVKETDNADLSQRHC